MAEAHPTWSNQRIGDELSVSEATVRRNLHEANFNRWQIPVDHVERFKYDLDEPMEVYGPVMITADWHIPLYDPVLVNKMINEARKERLTQLIIGGDFFNYDSLSQYDPKQQDAGLEREHREGLQVMSVLLETFDDIYYVWGNHDSRLHKALAYKMQFKSAMQMVFGELGTEAMDKLHFSNLDHLWARPYPGAPKEESWYVCHPASYNRTPLATARQLTAKWGSNVITMHSHHAAVGPGHQEGLVAIEGGGLFDRSKTSYLQRSTTFPFWSQGYSFLNADNKPTVRSPWWNV